MKNHILEVLKNKQFSFLLASELLSQVAFNMMNFMLLIVVFKLSKSNTAVSGIVLSFTIPAIIFGMLAGVYVDRWNKKKVLFWTNAVRALLLIPLAIFSSNLLLIYFFSFATAIVTQFFIPAETPIIPLLVKKDFLLSANALFGMGIYGSILLAYALSSPFLIFFGQSNAFLALTVLFFLSALFVSLIKISKNSKFEEQASVISQENNAQYFSLNPFKEFKMALNLLAKTKEIYGSLFLLTISQILILVLAVIGPGFAHQILGIRVDEFPLVFVTPAAFGMVFGAIIIGNFFHNKSRRKMANIGVFLAGLSVLLLPYGSKVTSREFVHTVNTYLPHVFTINILHIVILLAFILGIANALIFVPSNTILQEETSDELRGKVYGALNSLVGIFSLLPIILVGELADIFGVSKVLTGIGMSFLILAFLRFLMKFK